MGCNSWQQVQLSDCPNCGKPSSASMGNSEWTHDYSCCSFACGERLGHRIKYGFKPDLVLKSRSKSYLRRGGLFGMWRDDHFYPQQPSALRIEIKKLRHRLKVASQ